MRGGPTGAVVWIQRFGSFLNVHLHAVLPDGVFVAGADGALAFPPLPAPSDDDVLRITTTIVRRVHKILTRRGPDDPADDAPFAQAAQVAMGAQGDVEGMVAIVERPRVVGHGGAHAPGLAARTRARRPRWDPRGGGAAAA